MPLRAPQNIAVTEEPRTIGRYTLLGEIAKGGMGSVHFGRMDGSIGFSRMVAIKRMLPEFVQNVEARQMIVEEAWLSSQIRHPNVVQMIDVVEEANEIFLVLDYVHGETLGTLLSLSKSIDSVPPSPIIVSILASALRGLHAAHEALDGDGNPLNIVHRDLSPQNVIIDVTGVARILDFGIAKATGRLTNTRTGEVKGKFAYMAPEQVHGNTSRQSDIFALGVVLWECCTMKRLFGGPNTAQVLSSVLSCQVIDPKQIRTTLDERLSAICLKALSKEPAERFETAEAMAIALEKLPMANMGEIAAWVKSLASEALDSRTTKINSLRKLSATPTPLAESTEAKPVKSNRKTLIAVAVGTVAFVAVAAVLFISREKTPTPIATVAAIPAIEKDSGIPIVPSNENPTHVQPPDVFVEEVPVDILVDANGTKDLKKPIYPKPKDQKRIQKPPAADCDPPWIMDADGHKKYKRECF
jgi:eukaryotic-like serine/threonine-protein kinase